MAGAMSSTSVPLSLLVLAYIALYVAIYAAVTTQKAGATWLAAELAGVACSFVHGVVCTIVASLLLYDRWQSVVNRDLHLTAWIEKDLAYAPNTRKEDWLMQFSCAYFLVDSVHLAVYGRKSKWETRILLAHHFATTAYEVTSWMYGSGAAGVLMLMAIGEITSPLQNIWVAARALVRRDSLAAMSMRKFGQSVYFVITPVYSFLFVLNRCFVGPPAVYFFVLGLVNKHARTKTQVPTWCMVLWLLCSFGGTAGGFWWAIRLKMGEKRRELEMNKEL